jgi:uncharacterized protein YjbJ (UPF0337 family)
MRDTDEAPEERPATWENELVGAAKEVAGRVFGSEKLTLEGEDQIEVARDVRDEYDERQHNKQHRK